MLATTRLNEPISITAKRHGYFPQAFVWRGKTYDVKRVEKCWSIRGRNWLGRVRQHYFRLWTVDDVVCEVYQDLRFDAWFLERMRDVEFEVQV